MQGIFKTTRQAQPRTTKTTNHTHYADTYQATPDQAGSEINDLWDMFTGDQPNSCIIVELFINGTPLYKTLDTRASVTIISSATW